MVSAVWKNSFIDYFVRLIAMIGVSFPVFLLALVALAIFHAQLGWTAGPGRLGFLIKDPPHITGLFTIDSYWLENGKRLLMRFRTWCFPVWFWVVIFQG